jgi:hypothetical protein
MTTVECSVEVDAPPEAVWKVISDPRSLPHWQRHIRAAHLPSEGLGPGSSFEVVMAFMGVHTTVPCLVREWEPPWHATVHLGGVLDATVVTSVAELPFDRSVLRHEVRYVFAGPLGSFAASGLRALGGAEYALRRGTLAQKREIESRFALGGR